MQRIEINPEEIWSYYPFAEVIPSLVNKILKEGWTEIPPIPVFRIPKLEEPLECKIEHAFIAMDGSHRRIAAAHLHINIPSAVYDYGEMIETEKHGLAPFRHSTNPGIYEKLTRMYLLRTNQPLKQQIATS